MKWLAARQSVLLAVTLSLALIGWLLSGKTATQKVAEKALPEVSKTPVLTSVRVRAMQTEMVSQDVVVSGRTESARKVTVRAEIPGRIVAIMAERGAQLQQGDIIAGLDSRDREARLQEAQALTAQRNMEYQAAQKLGRKGMQSETQLAQAQASLDAASARLKQIQVEIEQAVLRAPFAGVLDQRFVEVGDFLSVGDPVGYILEQNPLLVVGQVSQHDIIAIQTGSTATVRLLDDLEVAGQVRYVARAADSNTQTFRIEVAIDNSAAKLVAGLTAEILIPIKRVAAYRITPALLALSDKGEIGIKIVSATDQVIFHPVTIVRAETNGIWVSPLQGIALPEHSRIITVGHGFVRDGQIVRAVAENDDAALAQR